MTAVDVLRVGAPQSKTFQLIYFEKFPYSIMQTTTNALTTSHLYTINSPPDSFTITSPEETALA